MKCRCYLSTDEPIDREEFELLDEELVCPSQFHSDGYLEVWGCRRCGKKYQILIFRDSASSNSHPHEIKKIFAPEDPPPYIERDPAPEPAPRPAAGAPPAHSARFFGKWRDAHSRTLVLKKGGNGVLADIFGPDGRPFQIRMLGDQLEPTTNLSGEWGEGGVSIEAGEPGLGPRLVLQLALDTGRFVPSVVMGMYDDYENDLGVPWIFPLAEFGKVG